MPDHYDFLVATGTRRPSDAVGAAARLFARLYGSPSTVLVVGDAAGFDAAMRDEWYRNRWPVYQQPAPWSDFERAWGKAKAKLAGPARNGALAGIAKALRSRGLRGRAVAVPDADSSGTWDCVKQLEDAGILVEVRRV